MLGALARRTGIYDILEPGYARLRRWQWERSDFPLPPPSAVKRDILRKFARIHNLRVLVETGTYRGDTVRALRGDFDTIFSIELDETLHADAVSRCTNQRNAILLKGDSAAVLPNVLDRLNGPALFWLDAHYSGGATATAAVKTPIGQELVAVLSHSVKGHVVLVDDHREFVTGATDYPSISVIEDVAEAFGYEFAVAADVIRLTPQ
jgi:hypothetical protein